LKDLVDGKADYVIAAYHPGLAEAAKAGLEDKIEVLDQALLTSEMFVAFSKKSSCLSLIEGFSNGITELTTDGSFETMEKEAQAAWDKAN
jgi:polar amino acid transport system substrate-binding protein